MRYTFLKYSPSVVCLALLTACGQSFTFYAMEKAKTQLRSETFHAEVVQKQDFLFVVDNSGSMNLKINSLKDEIRNFVTRLNQNGVIDMQAAVTLTDGIYQKGALVASPRGVTVAKSSSPTGLQDFAEILLAVGPTPNSHLEMGMVAAEMAITLYGSEFMRPGVPLAVLLFSDADDQSCDITNCKSLTPLNHFVEFFKGLPVPTTVFSMAGPSLMVGGNPTFACSDMEDIGQRYADLQLALNMEPMKSICPSDIPSGIDFVANTVADTGTCFKLAEAPTELFFDVHVGGVKIPQDAAHGYTFQPATNSICMPYSLIAHSSDAIEIDYEVWTQE